MQCKEFRVKDLIYRNFKEKENKIVMKEMTPKPNLVFNWGNVFRGL